MSAIQNDVDIAINKTDIKNLTKSFDAHTESDLEHFEDIHQTLAKLNDNIIAINSTMKTLQWVIGICFAVATIAVKFL